MVKKIFNGESAIFGRISSIIAKELLKGNNIVLINSEKVLISGNKEEYVKKMRAKLKMGRGSSMKGPKYIRREDLILKRMIRGMLPWDRAKGRNAFKNLRCYISLGNLPEEEIKKAIKIEFKKPIKSFTVEEFIRALK
ncbi:MAG: 50S ribosomal protein L13 [Candidatus Pacearchaeota archaeon]